VPELRAARNRDTVAAHTKAPPIVSTTVPNQIALEPVTVKATKTAKTAKITGRGGFLDKYFYFSMSLLIAAVVIYGFSHTVGQNLIHPREPRPLLLYIHAAVFSSWLLFFILQSALIRTHRVKLHRTLGWFGAALGVAIIVFGVAISITMARFNGNVLHQPYAEAFMAIPLWDITCFTITFSLAILWRKKPEFHRRLILIASCALTAAGWGRIPLLPNIVFYSGVDFLILLGVARDLIVTRAVHPVYRYALPAFICGQVIVTYAANQHPAWWLRIAHALAS
jgi:hypothetical protein